MSKSACYPQTTMPKPFNTSVLAHIYMFLENIKDGALYNNIMYVLRP